MVAPKQLVLAVLALSFAAVTSNAETATAPTGVVTLTPDNYEETISDGKVYFIKFYAPWCGHCKRLAPTWAELADMVKDNDSIRIANVDCTGARDICQNAEIKGYPTLKVLHNGEEYKTHRGGRDLAALRNFVEDAARDLLTEV